MNYISDNKILLGGNDGSSSLYSSGLIESERIYHTAEWTDVMLDYFGINNPRQSIYSQEEIDEIRKAFQSIAIIQV